MALPPPFIAGTPTAGFVPGGRLQTLLDERINNSPHKGALSQMGIALADLTDIGENPDPSLPFAVKFAASINLEREMQVFSLAKIVPMIAAFRLRERVNVAAGAVDAQAKTGQDLVNKIAAEWKSQVTSKISKPPNDFPDLAHIFGLDGRPRPAKVNFTDSTRDFKALQDLDPPPFHGVAKSVVETLDFVSRMRLMIRWSCNNSAGSCVRDLGFQYMNGALADDGFADNKKNGILWLGGDYGFGNKATIMRQPPWDRNPEGTWVRANAKGVASFLTLLWTNRLLKNQEACKEMREIMLEREEGLGTDMVRETVPRPSRAFSKVGLNGVISEGVIIESRTSRGLLRYAGVGLRGNTTAVMKELAGIFRDCIAAIH